MVQQSHNAWQSQESDQAAGSSSGPTVGSWMQDVLGSRQVPSPQSGAIPPASTQPTISQAPERSPGANSSPDLQSRLAAIARNIEALETKVTGEPNPSVTPPEMAPQITPQRPEISPVPPGAPTEPATAVQNLDPLEALRRRKMELEGSGQTEKAPVELQQSPVRQTTTPPQQAAVAQSFSADVQPQMAEPAAVSQPAVSSAPQMEAPQPSTIDAGVEQLSAHIDEQFSRLTRAIEDVRQIAEAGANDQARLEALESYMTGSAADNDAKGAALADLSEQVRAVRDAITAMPAPDAIKSLEDGYHHVLTRLDTLKDDGASAQKIDALYEEVTGLRELLDQLREGGTAAVVDEMRGMLQRLEREPGANSARIAEALEVATSMAENQSSAGLNDAIGAVVERLVALEARIEALAAGQDDGPLSSRLDAIHSEMSRLATFQDEAKGLSQALDAVREEVRSSNAHVDWSTFDQRFGALDRIEQITGGYADQISALSERLSALDATIANQSDMARQVSALSRQMETFTNAMPVREIEQAVLELTGRVTALQEDTGTERLAMAVRELGERVKSCIRSIPKTEAIIEAVEAKIGEQLEDQLDVRLSSAMEPVVARLDSLHTAITEADGPLIEHMAGRLEALINAMPTPRAEDALSALEQQLGELNQRQAEAGVISRDDVTRLHNELTRARASVELGSNRDLQRAIVDQVRHLADRFEDARVSGDAAVLPEVEAQIEALASRVQSLGLFETQTDQQSANDTRIADDLIQHIDQRLDDLGSVSTSSMPVVDQLHEELAALRRNASDQDLRMHQTLENVQQALENVGQRISALESDEKAALSLAEANSADVGTEPAEAAPTPDVVDLNNVPSIPPVPVVEAMETPEPVELPDTDQVTAETDHNDQVEETPEPGDAQELLRQLTGAMNVDGVAAVKPRSSRPSRARSGSARPDPNNVGGSPDTASQRASFIAAARRAAQTAALQAAAGKGPATNTPVQPQRAVDPSLDPFAPSIGEPTDGRTDKVRKEPQIDAPEPSPQEAPVGVATPDKDPMEELGGAAKTSRIEQKKRRQKEQQRQKTMSRAMIFALMLFTLGLGLFVVTLILPTDPEGTATPAAVSETATDIEEQLPAETSEAANNDPRILPTPDEASSVRVVGESAAPAATGFEAASSSAAQNPDAPDVLAEAGTAPSPSELDTLGSGFERDRGPVMAETPNLEATAAAAEQEGVETQSEPGTSFDTPQSSLAAVDTLGPLSGLSVPAIPPATANALPEAIGSPRLRVAAAGGDSSAQFEIATRYMEGRFVPQDFAAAAHWYGLAAEQGNIPATYRLGSFYEQGRGVDRDTDSAIAWYESAARGGNPRAMHNLAVMAAEGRGPGGVASPDFERAAGWFQAAAERGLSDSQFNLAVLFARGMGVERDLLESYKWFALAANAGDGEAVGRRDEVAGVLGEEALALARARVDNWQAIPIERSAVEVAQPEGGWDDSPVRASGGADISTAQAMIAEAQSLLAQRGYEPGPADGLVGPRTSDAVRAFRQSAGLGDSDVIDAALLNALRGGGNL